MKKLLYIIECVIFCITLCACDPGVFIIEDEHLEDVVSIQLVEYDNPDQQSFITWVPNQFDKLKQFDLKKCVILETLPKENNSSFLHSFKESEILHTYYAYDSPKDICIKLNYENDQFLIIWANYKNEEFAGYIGKYYEDGTVLSFWGSFSNLLYYEQLVNNYFSITSI